MNTASKSGFTSNRFEIDQDKESPKKKSKIPSLKFPLVIEEGKAEGKKYQNPFKKIGEDGYRHFGDGGDVDLKIPLYYAKQLNVSFETKKTLVQCLENLGEERKDWHEESPVLDIIDPDLDPNYYSSSEWINSSSERSKYSWFPTDVIITPLHGISIAGEIRNLEIKYYKELYQSLLKVFQQMLPAFEELGLVSNKVITKLQVVVKAQKYCIAPGSAYSGKWHTEGKTENIVAAGVYYCKIDNGFPMDKVVFRPKEGPSSYYADFNNIKMDYELDVFEGTAIVFSNSLPHKFYRLENRTSQPLNRLFVNFFIVDPSNPLESTTFYYNSWKMLIQKLKFAGVVDLVLSFLVSKLSISEAKQRRKLSREAMKYELGVWGYPVYGNAGYVNWIDSNYKDELRDIQYVDVDSDSKLKHNENDSEDLREDLLEAFLKAKPYVERDIAEFHLKAASYDLESALKIYEMNNFTSLWAPLNDA